MTEFSKTLLGRPITAVEDLFDTELHAAIDALQPSILKLEAYAKANGIPALKALVGAVFAGAATAAAAGNLTPAAIGDAAIAAAAPLVANDVASAADELHAIAAAAVTDVKAALKANA